MGHRAGRLKRLPAADRGRPTAAIVAAGLGRGADTPDGSPVQQHRETLRTCRGRPPMASCGRSAARTCRPSKAALPSIASITRSAADRSPASGRRVDRPPSCPRRRRADERLRLRRLTFASCRSSCMAIAVPVASGPKIPSRVLLPPSHLAPQRSRWMWRSPPMAWSSSATILGWTPTLPGWLARGLRHRHPGCSICPGRNWRATT